MNNESSTCRTIYMYIYKVAVITKLQDKILVYKMLWKMTHYSAKETIKFEA